jgi:2-oxoglutarate ferredoxin oxidoreductase subunit beta
MMALLPGVRYLERTTITSPKEVLKTKKAIRKAFDVQMKGLGFSMVEVLSPCPTYWGIDPVKSMKHIETNVTKQYPLGVIKDDVESGL